MIPGLLLIDKPEGITSFQAVDKIKMRFRVKKAGHTGTLDPMATGLLAVCLGRATKMARFLADADKTYQGRISLGIETDTFDAQGKIVACSPVPQDLTIKKLAETAAGFTGRLKQAPPAFSAAKHNGVPLYRFARKGIAIERSQGT